MPYRDEMVAGAAMILRALHDRIGPWTDIPGMGPDPNNGHRTSPERFADALIEMTEGYVRPFPFNMTTFPAETHDMVIRRSMKIASTCEHHLLPWYGKAGIAYIPNNKMLGLSKFPRYIRYVAHRFSTQETLTALIADGLNDILEPTGLYFVVKAEHTCEICRGAYVSDAETETRAIRGVFKTDPAARAEATAALV